MDRGETRHVVLVGMMGAGKTTVARSLSQRLSRPFYDCDEQLTIRTARSGAEIARREGVAFLHQLEQEILLDALTAPEPAVITAAGSAVESEVCQRALRQSAYVVWLDAPVAILAKRMPVSEHRRPLDAHATAATLAARRSLYERVADLHLDAQRPVRELVDSIIEGAPGSASGAGQG